MDQDCNGLVDDAAIDARAWYPDLDGDGFGDALAAANSFCMAAAGYSEVNTDCDDENALVNPAQAEVPYNGADDDCAGGDATDLDGDGWDSTAAGGGDCDDENSSVAPGMAETWANGITDNDCDGERESTRMDFGASAWIGPSAGGQAGRTIGALGDVTGDGLAEYLVAAVYESSRYVNGGAIYLVEGGVATGELAEAHALLPGGDTWFMSSALSGGPDIDGDDVPDFVATAPGYEEFSGAAYLVSGAAIAASASLQLPEDALGQVTGGVPGDYLGTEAQFLGDVVGDGGEYLAVTALFADVDGVADAGTVSIFDAREVQAAELTDAVFEASGYFDGEKVGHDVAPAGDVNNDGVDDYMVSASSGDLAVILPGGVMAPHAADDAIFRLAGTGAGETGNVRMIGDVDGDGVRDLACIIADSDVLIYIALAGNPVVTTANAAASIEPGDGSLVYDLLDLGDLDGDGRAETYVPAQWYPDLATSFAGIVFGEALTWRATANLADSALTAASVRSDSRFGYRVALSEDVDGDGGEDIIVAGYSDAQGGTDAGAVLTLPVPR